MGIAVTAKVRLVALAALLTILTALGAWLIAFGGSRERLDSFRRSGETTLVVQGERGEGDWSRVVSVEETATSVTVTVKTLSIPLLPRSAVGYPTEFIIELDAPLGDRLVTDGFGELSERD